MAIISAFEFGSDTWEITVTCYVLSLGSHEVQNQGEIY
jgi:hypothetical protein